MAALIIVIVIIILMAVLFVLMGGTDIHFHKKPENGKIRVACVGDSITNGCFAFPCFKKSYPAQLRELLGDKYHVENFGLNDRDLQSTGDKPYTSEREYDRSLDFDPDIVVILLGTNDTKDINWNSEQQFIDQYRELINSYLRVKDGVSVILCTPPWALEAKNFIAKLTNDCVTDVLANVCNAVWYVAEKCELPVVDLYTAFEGKRKLLAHDGLHPNAKGAALIAKAVSTEIIDTGK